MNFEEKIKECELNLNQIKHYDPDPFYVNYFFQLFLKSVNDVYDGIFEELDKNFGLFVAGKHKEENVYEKALLKKDEKALEFFIWFKEKMEMEHKAPFPRFIKDVLEFQKNFKKLPKIKIMMRSKERYLGDINQEILVNLTNGKLRAKEELEIEMKRNLPIFLQIINHKRTLENKPKINQKQTTVSAFMQIGEKKEFEIYYACKIYIPVLKRILTESEEKIRHLSRWN